MQRSAQVEQLLRARAARRPAPGIVELQSAGVDRLAAELRSRFDQHPKQREFWQAAGEHRRDAALCTRRAGKSDGGVHEWMALALTTPGWRGMYVNETRPEARRIVWRNDMALGFCNLVAKHGEAQRGGGYRLGEVTARPNESTLELDFSNGSQIALFGADDEAAIHRARGPAKDQIWCDEAQKFKHLRAFILQVAGPSLKDKRGRAKLTGTPSEDAAGYFYDVTCDPESGDVPLVGWDVYRWSVLDNPWFGATPEERYERTAGETLRENGWQGDEPEFLREWGNPPKWIKSDARYVYPVHAAPGHVPLCYAPERLVANSINARHPRWLDVQAALADLPRAPRGRKPYTWLYAIGADFGYAQDPFAIVVWAMTHDLPDIFELFSWKEFKVIPDDQRDYLKELWDALDNVIVLVGDPAGQVSAQLAGWRERIMLPIDEAEKSSKATWQAMMAGDIRKGRVRYRGEPDKKLFSPLLTEHKHLVYLPTKPGKPLKDHADRRTSDGKVHGNHCFVAGTPVETMYGPRPIEQIVPGDLVHTRAGIRTVTSACSTGWHPTLEIALEDGRILRGTAEHPIATPCGWVPLAELMPGDTVIAWESTDGPRRLSSTGSGIGATQRPSTGPRASTSCGPSSGLGDRGRSRSTERFGNTTTTRFLTGITSTIATRIRSTTTSRTSPASQAPTTSESMARHLSELRDRAPVSTWLASPPRSGMDPRPDALGIPCMVARPWLPDRSSSSPASNAASGSSQSRAMPSCAAGHVERRTDAPAVSMTSSAHASSAARSSWSTDSACRHVALVRVVRVAPTGCVEETFDLSVDDRHEFFANGIVVSNCSDAGLYAFRHLTHYLAKGAVDKPPPGSPAAYAAEEEREHRAIEDAERRRAREIAERDELAREYGGGDDGGYQW